MNTTAEIFEIEPFRHEFEGEARFTRGAPRGPRGPRAASKPWPSFRKRRILRTPSIYGGWGGTSPDAATEPQAEPEPPPSAASPEYVRWLQSTLNRAIGGALPIDGIMSGAVRDAIREFQRKNRLPVSGYIGPDTESALRRVDGGAEIGELEFETESELTDPIDRMVDNLLWTGTRILFTRTPPSQIPVNGPMSGTSLDRIPEKPGWYRIFSPSNEMFPNGGFYTGSTQRLRKRLGQHFNCLRHLGVDYRRYMLAFVTADQIKIPIGSRLDIGKTEYRINQHYRGRPASKGNRQVLNIAELEFPEMESAVERNQFALVDEPKPNMEAIMHPISCGCPRCLSGGTGEFEFEYEAFESGEMSEQEELELAMELLSVQNEYEMEQFLGNLVRGIGRGLKSVGRIALPALAKVALPIAGRALGSFIPIPGVGTMIGGALGRAAADALEFEYSGVDPGQANVEKARRIVRVLSSAVRNLPQTLGSMPPEAAVRASLTSAVRRNIPAANLAALGAVLPGELEFSPAAGVAATSGRWWRRGNTIVLDRV
jgi:hypothetical protein